MPRRSLATRRCPKVCAAYPCDLEEGRGRRPGHALPHALVRKAPLVPGHYGGTMHEGPLQRRSLSAASLPHSHACMRPSASRRLIQQQHCPNPSGGEGLLSHAHHQFEIHHGHIRAQQRAAASGAWHIMRMLPLQLRRTSRRLSSRANTARYEHSTALQFGMEQAAIQAVADQRPRALPPSWHPSKDGGWMEG